MVPFADLNYVFPIITEKAWYAHTCDFDHDQDPDEDTDFYHECLLYQMPYQPIHIIKGEEPQEFLDACEKCCRLWVKMLGRRSGDGWREVGRLCSFNLDDQWREVKVQNFSE